jgi:hypothetical protein
MDKKNRNKNVICEVCKYEMRSDNLKKHMQTHSNEPYPKTYEYYCVLCKHPINDKADKFKHTCQRKHAKMLCETFAKELDRNYCAKEQKDPFYHRQIDYPKLKQLNNLLIPKLKTTHMVNPKIEKKEEIDEEVDEEKPAEFWMDYVSFDSGCWCVSDVYLEKNVFPRINEEYQKLSDTVTDKAFKTLHSIDQKIILLAKAIEKQYNK